MIVLEIVRVFFDLPTLILHARNLAAGETERQEVGRPGAGRLIHFIERSLGRDWFRRLGRFLPSFTRRFGFRRHRLGTIRAGGPGKSGSQRKKRYRELFICNHRSHSTPFRRNRYAKIRRARPLFRPAPAASAPDRGSERTVGAVSAASADASSLHDPAVEPRRRRAP